MRQALPLLLSLLDVTLILASFLSSKALADVAKGNETVEWACSLPQLAPGRNLQVSGQVYCQDKREPLGVVASIVPFNFVSTDVRMT